MDPFGSLAPQIDPLTGAQAPSDAAQGKFNRTTDAIVQALRNWIETPGRAMREGITTDQAVDWAAPTAMGMVAGARLPGGAPEGALGSSGAKLAQPEGIRAYHGSPHDFDRFDLSKIGTGEGAQAYGHGLYFAENEGVARNYRAINAPPGEGAGAARLASEALALAEKKGLSGPEARSFAMDWLNKEAPKVNALSPQHYYDAMNNFDVLTKGGGHGRMYEVNIGAKPEQFLDWDKPLSQQGEYIGSKLKNVFDPAMTGKDAYQSLIGQRPGQGGGMTSAGMKLSDAAPNEASGRFNATGIPGIRYLDQGSRTNVNTNDLRGSISMFERALRKHPDDEMLARELASAKDKLALAERGATSNYVVFDPGIIDILRKYGLAGGAAVGAGGTAANDAFGSLAPQTQ